MIKPFRIEVYDQTGIRHELTCDKYGEIGPDQQAIDNLVHCVYPGLRGTYKQPLFSQLRTFSAASWAGFTWQRLVDD